MALVIADRVKETTTTTGTGTVTLAGASTGYQSFAVVGNGNTTFYCIAGQTTSEWEVGIGTYTASGTSLARTTVLSSSNSGSLVNFSAGTKDVFVTYPSERSVNLDGSSNLVFSGINAQRFQADFTNATVINRFAFQTGTANSATGVYALPNGTSTAASWQATNAADPTNVSKILIATNGSTDVQLVSGINGTGTYLPLTFWNSGAEKMRLDINGNFGIGLTPVASNGILQLGGYSSIQALMEKATVSATAATGTINFDAVTQAVLYYTSNASANWTLNIRGSSGLTLNNMMQTGQSLTIAFLVTQGATAYYNSAVQVDGSSVTPKWQGGTAPTSGNASGIDVYVYTTIKTGSATFTVLASRTQFK